LLFLPAIGHGFAAVDQRILAKRPEREYDSQQKKYADIQSFKPGPETSVNTPG
jgi:hypothetical protein